MKLVRYRFAFMSVNRALVVTDQPHAIKIIISLHRSVVGLYSTALTQRNNMALLVCLFLLISYEFVSPTEAFHGILGNVHGQVSLMLLDYNARCPVRQTNKFEIKFSRCC